MANALYRRIPATGTPADWMRQDGNGPCYFQITRNPDDGLWYAHFTYDGATWFFHANGVATPALAQSQLDTYVGNLNAGTA